MNQKNKSHIGLSIINGHVICEQCCQKITQILEKAYAKNAKTNLTLIMGKCILPETNMTLILRKVCVFADNAETYDPDLVESVCSQKLGTGGGLCLFSVAARCLLVVSV